MGCDPWRVSGGELWSKAYGKVCPGDRRIDQLIDVVIPRVHAAVYGGGPAVPKEWDEMATKEEVQAACAEAVRQAFNLRGSTTREAVRDLARLGVGDALTGDDAVGSAGVKRQVRLGVDQAFSERGSSTREGAREVAVLAATDVVGARLEALESKLDAVLAKFPDVES
jgi:hypothetical protein